MRYYFYYFLLVIICLLFVACSSGSTIKETSVSQINSKITSDEISSFISKFPVGSAYDMIYVLRPSFLNSRGRRAPVTYMNGTKLGALRELHQISVSNLVEVQFMNSSDAATFYGGRHPFGIIHLTTK